MFLLEGIVFLYKIKLVHDKATSLPNGNHEKKNTSKSFMTRFIFFKKIDK